MLSRLQAVIDNENKIIDYLDIAFYEADSNSIMYDYGEAFRGNLYLVSEICVYRYLPQRVDSRIFTPPTRCF